MLSPLVFFDSGSWRELMSWRSFECMGSLLCMFFQTFGCISGIKFRPLLMSSTETALMLTALSPTCWRSCANLQTWHFESVQEGGFRDAKSLEYISFPGLCLISTGSSLNPVKKALILALDEKAPLIQRLHASTHGIESV